MKKQYHRLTSTLNLGTKRRANSKEFQRKQPLLENTKCYLTVGGFLVLGAIIGFQRKRHHINRRLHAAGNQPYLGC
jgi:hypothetical protein